MSRRLLRWWPIVVIAVGSPGVLSLVGAAAGPAPAFQAGAWVSVTGNLANMPSECGNVTLLSAVPGSDTVIAGVAGRGLWANKGGSTWSQLGDGAGSATIPNRPSWITYDPGDPGVFWESGLYNYEGIFKTTNGGKTFQRLGPTAHHDYVSVDFRDPDRKTLLAGGHEQSQMVYLSQNGGKDWTNIGANLPARTKFSSSPLVINAQTYLVNVQGYNEGTAGIYRTTDGGATWQQVSTQGPTGPPLVSLTGAIYWALEGSLLKSTNSGVTWTEVGRESNLQAVHPIELPNGRLIAVAPRSLMISADAGATWSPIGPPLPFVPSGLVSSPRRGAIFIWLQGCDKAVSPTSIMMAT